MKAESITQTQELSLVKLSRSEGLNVSHIHRRDFCRAGVVALANYVIGPLPRQAVDESRRSIFDAHLHIPGDNGEVLQWNLVTRTMPEFVSYLDRCNVQRGVISSARSIVAKTAKEFCHGNREVARYAETYKGRFKGSCVVAPFQIDEALREIEDCRKQLGFVWLGEFCNYMTGYRYDTPEWAQVMNLAAELNMVVQIHTDVSEMGKLADSFPRNTIVFPHFGRSLKDIEERISIVARHKNTYIDISGSGVERVGILEKAVKQIGAERVLYGSDFTINEPSAVISQVKNAFLTPEEREMILFRNIERLISQHT